MGAKESNVEQGSPKHLVVRLDRAVGTTTLLFIIVVYLLLAYATYSLFTSRIPSGNDFYPRWVGTRAFIMEGKNPYSDEVTMEIQRGIYGRLAREDEDQVAFAYPLYACLLVLPFALLPYPLAQAFWASALILTALGALFVALRTLDWQPSPTGLAGLALFAVLFYPTARAILLGQISIVVLALVVLALWTVKSGHQILAGCLLALSTVKPQMVFLIVPFLLLWAAKRREYKAIAAFFAAMALLLAISWIALPGWIRAFVEGLIAYRSYTSIYRGGASAIGYLVGAILPSSLSTPVTLALSLGMSACLAYTWFAVATGRWHASLAFSLTIVATLLLPGDTGTTNQVLLLLPLFSWLPGHSKQRWLAGLIFAALLLGPWVGFFCTVQGDLEHPAMVLPLPIAALLMLPWKTKAGADTESTRVF
ncbi:MAG: DUF2029 domain-containing protein [Anaerolineae bacterium]|nr:DUF2029 domain-containing protein [Anaerolineae bacterium]